MEKKKIVHIITSLKRGGAESLLVDLLAELTGYEHHVIYFHDGPNRQRLEQIGIKTYQIKGLLSLYDSLFFIRFWRIVKLLNPYCIHSALWAANFAARIIAQLQKIPLVSVMHLGVHQDGTLRNIIDAISFKLSQNVIAVSQEVAESVKNRAWLPAERIVTIKNGINPKRIIAEGQREYVERSTLGIQENDFVIGSVGRFIERKNFPLLLNAVAEIAREHKTVKLVLIGFGPLEKTLRDLAQSLAIKDRVQFIVGKAAYGYYNLFDCFVLPSFQEGMSIALLEAMSFSVPCIVTSSTLEHEVIKSGQNGYVIPSNDQAALVEHIKGLMTDATLRNFLASKAYTSVEQDFSMKAMADNYLTIFDSFSRQP